ncbi:hypothetical protein FGO68_gene11188 [Halteria grandinella]|uniref:Uncharacterized protein n=1 Tax=Halteria grandinella TaxID=5974 RepID=A0A8J8NN32_HALGN|nr:hypothetical protein FGO68_gene11188 [Halteria grandinella]
MGTLFKPKSGISLVLQVFSRKFTLSIPHSTFPQMLSTPPVIQSWRQCQQNVFLHSYIGQIILFPTCEGSFIRKVSQPGHCQAKSQ